MRGILYYTGSDEPGQHLTEIYVSGAYPQFAHIWLGSRYLELDACSTIALRDELSELIEADNFVEPIASSFPNATALAKVADRVRHV